jgi:hypothetical protein
MPASLSASFPRLSDALTACERERGGAGLQLSGIAGSSLSARCRRPPSPPAPQGRPPAESQPVPSTPALYRTRSGATSRSSRGSVPSSTWGRGQGGGSSAGRGGGPGGARPGPAYIHWSHSFDPTLCSSHTQKSVPSVLPPQRATERAPKNTPPPNTLRRRCRRAAQRPGRSPAAALGSLWGGACGKGGRHRGEVGRAGC